MKFVRVEFPRPCGVLALAGALLPGVTAAAAPPTLTSAVVDIAFDSAETCRVAAEFRVDADPAISTLDHRVWMRAGSSFVDPPPAAPASAMTRSLPSESGVAYSMAVPLPLDGAGVYRVDYGVRRPGGLDGRCPIPVPAAASTGGRAVDLTVRLPAGWTPGADAFPALVWAETTGRGALGHVPAFVHVAMVPPDATPGVVARVGFNRLVDAAALGVLAVASGWWLERRRRA